MGSAARSLSDNRGDGQPSYGGGGARLRVLKNNTLSPEEQDRLLGKIFGPKWMRSPESYFLYEGEKAKSLFKQVLADPKYVYHQRGLNLIKNNRDILLSYVGKNLTDWGSGDGSKAALLLEGIDRKVNYIPVDYSDAMLKDARKTLSKNDRVNTKEGIIITGDSTNLVQGLESNTYFFMGGTIGNFPEHKNIQDFKNMSNSSFFEGNNTIFQYHSAPTQEELGESHGDGIYDGELYQAYDTDSAEAWFKNGLEMLGFDGSEEGGLGIEDCKFHVQYVKDPNCPEGIDQHGEKVFPGCIQSGFIAQRDGVKTLSNGDRLSIQQGTFYPILFSRRYTESEIGELLKASGLKKVRASLQQERGTKLAIARKPPSKFEKHKRKIQNALLIALAASVGVVGTIGYNAKVKRDNERAAAALRGDMQVSGHYGDTILDKEDFDRSIHDIYRYFSAMYDLSKVSAERQKDIKLLLASDLGRKNDDGYAMILYLNLLHSRGKVYDYLQQFFKDYAQLLARYGVIIDQPYAQLANLREDFERTLQMSGEVSGLIQVLNGRIFSNYSSGSRSFYAQRNTLSSVFKPRYQSVVDRNAYHRFPEPHEFTVVGELVTFIDPKFGIEYRLVQVVRFDGYQESGPYVFAISSVPTREGAPFYEISSVPMESIINSYYSYFGMGNTAEESLLTQN